jgi:4-aminobutyrate aminotransferase
MDQHATDLLTDWDALRDGVPSVWARYTDLVVARGEGAWLETVDGTRYLDYTSGIGVTNTGHAHPKVAAAIAAQAARGIHFQQNIVYHQPGLELHDRLARRFPNRVAGADYGLFLSNSGAEAVEAAMKLAKMATHRTNVVAFRGGFHGRTHGAMALTSSGVKYRGHFEPLLGGVHFVPFPYPLRHGGHEAALAATLEALDDLFATLVYPDDVAAFIVEPIIGEGGYVIPPDGFLPALRAVADRHGILLAVDEVQTGFARTGRFFATEWTDATPDILIMAKGMASGLPLSGILARRDLLERFAPGAHGGTYGGNVIACAAALATLDVIDDERLADRARHVGARLLAGLREAADGHPAVAEVRGRGAMVAIELAEGPRLTPRPDLAKALLAGALARNLLLLTCGTYGQVVRIIPPLVTTDDEVERAVRTIGESLDAIGA